MSARRHAPSGSSISRTLAHDKRPKTSTRSGTSAAGRLLGDEAELGGMRSRASAALSTISGALPRTIEALLEYLPSEESLQAGLPKDLEKGLARAS